MSLKAFHLLFICCSTLLAFWLGAWAIAAYGHTPGALLLAAGIASIGAGAALVVYGVRFLKKLRNVSFL